MIEAQRRYRNPEDRGQWIGILIVLAACVPAMLMLASAPN